MEPGEHTFGRILSTVPKSRGRCRQPERLLLCFESECPTDTPIRHSCLIQADIDILRPVVLLLYVGKQGGGILSQLAVTTWQLPVRCQWCTWVQVDRHRDVHVAPIPPRLNLYTLLVEARPTLVVY